MRAVPSCISHPWCQTLLKVLNPNQTSSEKIFYPVFSPCGGVYVILVGLLDPVTIGSLRLRNRIVLPPMATELAGPDGEVTDRLVEHYKAMATEQGLMIVEHSFITPNGRRSPRQLGIHDSRLVPGLSKLVKAVHDSGTPLAIEMNHAGRTANSQICGAQPVGPSAIPVVGGETPRELDIEEIGGLVDAFEQAANRAVKAGFDAVEVHGAHGFLLNQFTSPLSNRRKDQYGGSLENRMRFPLEVVKRVREAIGAETLLLYRIGADDMTPGGFTLEEGKKLAVNLADVGVQVIDVSGGMCGSRPAGSYIHLATGIKSAVSIPVIGVGGIKDCFSADEVVKTGKADLVAVGRAQLADSSWAVKAIQGLRDSTQSEVS